MKNDILKWLRQAEADSRTAKHSFESEDYYAAAFWCQQTVEKALKYVILTKGKEIIRTHDVIYLGKKAEIPDALLEKIKPLLAVAIESRYGDILEKMPFEKFTQGNTESFIIIANEVLKWIQEI